MKPPRRTPVRGRILVADGSPEVLEATARLVRKMGFEPVVARDPEQTLALARTGSPDLILLDLSMPGVSAGDDGLDFLLTLLAQPAAQLTADPADVRPGVVVSMERAGSHPGGETDRATELGAFGVVSRPFQENYLTDIIERFFAERLLAVTPPSSSPAAPYAPSLDRSGGYWKLWGTRGSIPVTGARYARHGGNTSCLEIARGDEVVIFDAGSGIRDLGTDLLARAPWAPGGKRRIRLVIGHTHWDHIQGFPFFAPAYVPGVHIDIYGAPGFGKDLESIFRGQLDRDYFPVELGDMAADLAFHRLDENPITFGDIQVGWEFTNHPGATIGFRIEIATPTGDRKLAYITDNEFLRGYTGRPHDITRASRLAEPVRKVIDLAAGTDLLIAEAQYLNADYPGKIGWGHSSVSNACILAREAGVKRWIVTHHDPLHDDDTLQNKLDLTRQILRDMNCDIDVTHAFDGMSQPL